MIVVWVYVLLQNELSFPSGCWDVLGSGALWLIASTIECAVHPCCSVITSCLPFVVFKHLRLGAFYLFHVCSEPQPLQIPYIEPYTHGKSVVPLRPQPALSTSVCRQASLLRSSDRLGRAGPRPCYQPLFIRARCLSSPYYTGML